MPGGDGTGPNSRGPMTGRGAGFCAGFGMPGHANSGGRGSGRGMSNRAYGYRGSFGRGRGFRNQYYATGMPGWMRSTGGQSFSSMTKEEELQSLKDQANYFKSAMDDISGRIKELESDEKKP